MKTFLNPVYQVSTQLRRRGWGGGMSSLPLCSTFVTFGWERRKKRGKYLYSISTREYLASARVCSTNARVCSTNGRVCSTNGREYSTSARDESGTYFSARSMQDSISTEESHKKGVLPKHCPGCGAAFQNSSKLKAGYLPPINLEDRQLDSFLTDDEVARIAKIEKSNEPISPKDVKLLMKKRNLSKSNTAIVCWKCHSSGHQNLLQTQQRGPVMLKTNRVQFSDLKIKSGGLLILMLDMMDLPNSIIEDLTDYTGQKDLIVLLSKAVSRYGHLLLIYSRILCLQTSIGLE
jgi:hypothetical protein